MQSPLGAINVDLVNQLSFYREPDLLIEILLVISPRCGLLVSGLLHVVEEPLDSGLLVLYEGPALIRCGSSRSVRRLEQSNAERMACPKQVKRFRFCCLVSLHVLRKCRQLQVLGAVRFVAPHVPTDLLPYRIIELLCFSVCLRGIGCGEIVFGAQKCAHGVEELGN